MLHWTSSKRDFVWVAIHLIIYLLLKNLFLLVILLELHTHQPESLHIIFTALCLHSWAQFAYPDWISDGPIH